MRQLWNKVFPTRRAWFWATSALCVIGAFMRVDGWLWGICMLAGAFGVWVCLQDESRLQWRHTKRWQQVAAGLLSLGYVYYFISELEDFRMLAIVLGMLGIPALWLFVTRMIHAATHALSSPVKLLCQKPFCWLFIAMLLGIVVAYSQTTMFYRPMIDGHLMRTNRVFSMDTGVLVEENVWMNLNAAENDFRHMLFALFAMPFSIPVYLIGKLFPLFSDFYVFGMALVQWVLILLSYAMVCDLVDCSYRDGLLLVLVLSYPTLIFMLNMEQYVFSVFWMISFLYASVRDMGGRKLLCIASTGSLLTSGLWEPLVAREKTWRCWLKETVATGMTALWLIVATGGLSLLNVFEQQTERYATYFKNVGISQRLLQYLNFVGSCLIAPATQSHEINGTWTLVRETPLNWIGLILLVLAVLGSVLFWDKLIVRFSAVWIGFSVVLLCILGYGSAENGMTLYILYFGWSFVLPAWLCVCRLTVSLGKWCKWILTACGLVLLAINVRDMLGLLSFACWIYPR